MGFDDKMKLTINLGILITEIIAIIKIGGKVAMVVMAAMFFTIIIAAISFGAIIAAKLALYSHKKRKAKRRREKKKKEEQRKAEKEDRSTPARIDHGSGSPIDFLTRKAIDGNKMARDLIDAYAELEATASKNGESIEALRGEFTQPFKAMDELLTVHDDMKANPEAYADPHALDKAILKSEASLKESILDKTQSITSKNVVKAKANAAYLTHR